MADAIVTPTAAQRRWHDMELGMFFHLDIPVFAQSWVWGRWQPVPDPELYQPHRLDTDQWLEAAKAMGARYAVFVAKHVSGFLQWQSDLYPYGLKQTSWRGGRGDVVADFVASCARHGIRPGLYASVNINSYLDVDQPGLINRGRGGDPERQAAYARTCERMAEELWSRYGELFEVWFDGGAIPAAKGGPDLLPILERHQPEAIVFQGPPGTRHLIRWVGNERGLAPYPCWSTIDQGTDADGLTEKDYSGSPHGRLWAPAECDVPIRNHEWFWQPDQEYKQYSLDALMAMYYRSVGCNGNLLLNANPGPDGLVPASDFQRYVELGAEIRRRFAGPRASTGGDGETVTLELPGPQRINHLSLMEDLAGGERVLAFTVQALVGGDVWQTLAKGSCIGHRRIVPCPTVEAARVRLQVTAAKATPRIRELAAWYVA